MHTRRCIQPAPSTPDQVLVDLDIAYELVRIKLLQADILNIQEEILKREERIQELKNQRNACSSVAKLHPEILQEIFLIFQHSRMAVDYEGRRDRDSYFSWSSILFVCRYWRTLAVSTPTLWTSISNAHNGRCELHLQRSVTAPLDVAINLYRYHPKLLATAKSIMKHVARIRTLEIYGNHAWDISHWIEELQHCIEFPLSDNTPDHGILESLHVDVTAHAGYSVPELSTRWFTIAPRLQHLKLKRVLFDWACIPLPHIRTLHLDFPRSAAPIGLVQLWKALQKTTFIQALTLWNLTLQHEAALPPTPSSKLALPSLMKLKMKSNSSVSIAWLLSTMTLPRALKYFQIRITKPVNGPRLYHGHADLFQALSGVPQRQYDLIDIQDDDLDDEDPSYPRRVTIYMDFLATHNKCDFESDESLFKVNLPLNRSETPAHAVTTHFFHIIANPNCLTHLSLTLKLPNQSFKSTFGSLPHLSAIKTTRAPAFESLVDALVIPINQPQNAPLTFPALTTITTFLRLRGISGRYDTENDSKWDQLLDCLMQRYEYGAPIDSLDLAISLTRREADWEEEDKLEKEFCAPGEIVPNYCLSLVGG